MPDVPSSQCQSSSNAWPRQGEQIHHLLVIHLTVQEIQGYCLSALRKLLTDKDEIIAAFEQARDAAFDLSAVTAEGNELQSELLVVSELMHQSMYENARVAKDQIKYNKYYTGLTERYDKAKSRLEEVNVAISDKQTRRATIESFLNEVKRLDGVTEFQPALWYGLTDQRTVYSKEDVRVTFEDGKEIKA